MTPLAKSALTWVTVLVLLVAGFFVHYQMVQGFFTPLDAVSPGLCRGIATGLGGAQDFALDPVRGILYVADPQGGIYRITLNDLAAPPRKLTGTPPDFHPHGISFYRAPDGGETLLAIDDKPGGRHIIESYGVTFDGDMATLRQQTAVQGRSLVSPQDLAAVAPDRFYVTNDHAATGALGRFAEDYLLWPHADVLTYNGLGLRIAVQRIAAPSGILARNGFLYVAARNGRRLLTFSIQDFTGNLTQIGALAIPARLGGISLDGAGNLIIAGQTRPGSSQIFRVSLGTDGIPQRTETLFSDDGRLLADASTAAVWNGHLLIGSSSGGKILDCSLK